MKSKVFEALNNAEKGGYDVREVPAITQAYELISYCEEFETCKPEDLVPHIEAYYSQPKGVMNDFKAFKFDRIGCGEVEVCSFNGSMAICCDDDWPVIITKEQAMAFFNLEPKVLSDEDNGLVMVTEEPITSSGSTRGMYHCHNHGGHGFMTDCLECIAMVTAYKEQAR